MAKIISDEVVFIMSFITIDKKEYFLRIKWLIHKKNNVKCVGV